jgi:hypothetical protein
MAGKGKKTFVAGEVLLAQDVNDYLMDQSVMNFASSAARSSAIPTPTEGMTTYVQDRNQIESYDGAEWRGMSGLQLVKKQAIDTGVASVTVTNAFSATYANYKIIVSDGIGSTAQAIGLRLGTSDVNYAYATSINNYVGGASTVLSANGDVRWTYAGESNSLFNNVNVDLHNPFLAKPTSIQGLFVGSGSSGATTGLHNVATSFSEFTINVTGTMTGGTIYVYGYGT